MSIGAAPPICGHCDEPICSNADAEAKPSFHADCLQILHNNYPGQNFCLERSVEHLRLNSTLLGASAASWTLMVSSLTAQLSETADEAKEVLKTGALLALLVFVVASAYFHDR